jgi:Rrf2 family protein
LQFTKGFDYAMRSLIYLAAQPQGKGVDLKDISRKQHVPVSYLAKIMRTLVRGGLVTSNLGRGGGYTLRRSPGEITMLQVYHLMEGEIRFVECFDDTNSCFLYKMCPQIEVWNRLQDAVESVFGETTLSQLVPKLHVERIKEEENLHVRVSP